MPLKYDHHYQSFNFSALVSIYYADGTVAISHGGIEMGQGIHTRIRTFAAAKLGIPVDWVSIKPTTTIASANSIETGASVTSEMNCLAVHQCCETLLERIEPIRRRLPNASWKEWIHECERLRIDLVATSMFTDRKPYIYSTYGATCSSVEIDVLTGEMHVLRSDIVYDCGESINQGIDIGQVEGAFVQGMGYFLSEKVSYDSETGVQLTTNTWEYKPPMSKDIPIDMRVHLLQQDVNPIGVVRSKAVGEPALCMAASCLFAAKDAIKAARKEANFCLDAPATIEKIQKFCQVKRDQLTFRDSFGSSPSR